MVESPKCPNCGVTMLVKDCFDTDCDIERGYITSECYGYCPTCRKKMRWTERLERVSIYDLSDDRGEE